MGDIEDDVPPSVASAIVAAADLAGVGITVARVVDLVPRARYVNRAAAQILGRSRDALLAHGLETVPPKERTRLLEQMRRRIDGDPVATAFETVVLHEDGREVEIHCSVGHLAIDGESSIVTFFRDISERRAAERARDASEARLRKLVEVAPDGIIVTRNGAMVYVNAAAARILGATDSDDLVQRPLAQLLAPRDLEAGHARLAAAQPDHVLPIRVYDVHGSNGKIFTVEATSLAIEWDGAPARLTFIHDITERVRMEAQLARADRLSALGSLAAGVAHEVNNPLTNVSLGLEALEQMLASLPDAKKADALVLIGEMRQGVERVAAITRDLRTFARESDAEPPGASDLASVLGTVERLVAHEMKHRAELVLDVPEGLPPVRGGPRRLEQVFVNLLLNAAQSFDPAQSAAVVRVRARAEGQGVTVEVTDNGPGIAPQIQARIFEPFFTTKPTGSGTGLGLAISQSIVADAGGELSVESEPGRGTTFRVALPVAEHTARLVTAAPSSPRHARILIIDDEPPLARSLGALLARDHDVEVMTSGADALEHLLAGETYDVVLCDVMMPNVSGIDLYERLAHDRPGEEAKIIFMTGGAFTDRARKFLARVPNRRIEKPFPIAELNAALGELVR